VTGVTPRPTRWLAAFILPFLVVASFLLYALPGLTEVHFAWTIVPPLTAMLLGSAYIGGIWFFVQVLRTPSWQRVKWGFPAVIVFASLLSIATFLHLDRFHPGHISFITWVVLYVSTPFLVAAAFLANQRVRSMDAGFVIPLPLRLGAVAIGLASLITGIVLFVVPALLVDSWAWSLTPLTARVVGAIITLPGMVNVWMLLDPRWSSFRAIVQAELISLLFIVGALLIRWVDLDWTRLATPFVVGGLVFSLVAFGVFYLYCERADPSGRVAR
jgi:hypothetical protein